MSVALEAPPKLSVRTRLLRLIERDGSLTNDGETNTLFFTTLVSRLGEPYVKPGTVGTELTVMERLGFVHIERVNGHMTTTRTVRLSTEKEKQEARDRDAKRKRDARASAKKVNNPDMSVLPVLADPGVVDAQLVDPAQAALDHAEALYFKRLLIEVANDDIHTFIRVAKRVG